MSRFEPINRRPLNGGWQHLYRFDNGFGASVVNHSFSYGTELAVLKWDGADYELTYDTPIAGDVIGHLSEDGVESLLERISSLTSNGHAPI
ncbi:hypothetical protein SAMN05216275_10537 [Streptosporangium canum]|uniref:Uncharacterized protein n=1 Tax=Streptosporangium canum TaxID=324952 RepID=A0A1I3L7A2_9ACTN|nr:hypothetical protein [Streptosporangium canum]SFI80587.1 hypothetical protein SAMN05216275_10537 [Streptosporangium canum]